MQSLRKLRVKLCHSEFAKVLFTKDSEAVAKIVGEIVDNSGEIARNLDLVVRTEGFVFDPLQEIWKERRVMESFEREVDWLAGCEKWDEKEKGFELTRVGADIMAGRCHYTWKLFDFLALSILSRKPIPSLLFPLNLSPPHLKPPPSPARIHPPLWPINLHLKHPKALS